MESRTPISKNNIVLIGMPASGKSTVGIVLAKALNYDFLDSDLLIQHQTGKRLETLMNEQGIDGFLAIENRVNCAIECSRTVIAPGGSIIYSSEAMEHFQKMATIVYLKVSLEMLQDRLHDMKQRGVALRDGQTLEDLYQERIPLYEKYADVTVEEKNGILEDAVMKILLELQRLGIEH